MPQYEVAILIRKLSRPATATVLKRSATSILKNNGILYAIENLGARPLPYRINRHGHSNNEASYFLLKFDSPEKAIPDLRDEYKRDVDIIRCGFTSTIPQPKIQCTLEEEMKPPAYRKDVQEMIEKGKSREKKFEYKTGLSYNPFTL